MASILIVDDHPANRAFLVTLLGYAGYRLHEAADGAEALAVTRQEHPDLVITDVLMPTMDGYEFVRRLRADSAIAHTPVIFYTAMYLEREAQALARDCGVEHVLVKPAAPDLILRTVASILAQAPLVPAPAEPAPPADVFEQAHTRLLTNKLAAKVDELTIVNDRLAALLDLSQRLAVERDPARLLQIGCDAARTIIGATYAVVDARSADEPLVRHFYTSGMAPESIPELSRPPMQQGLFAHLIATGHSLRTPNIGGHLRASGFPSWHPKMTSFLGVPMASATWRYGILYLADKLGAEEFSAEDEQIAATLASQVAIAYENARLFEQVRSGAESLRLMSQQLVRAQEDERRHIARELHDEVGQSLTATLLNLQILSSLTDLGDLPARLGDSMSLIERVLQQVRNLSLSLRPALLDDLGLAPALRWLVSRQAERAGFSAQFNADLLDERFAADIEITCFRAVQEAITNVVRYAQARSVTVELLKRGAEVCVRICDDGVGFDVPAALRRAAHGQSMGLLSMQERVRLLGGRMRIESSPGSGTTIEVCLPAVPPAAEVPALVGSGTP